MSLQEVPTMSTSRSRYILTTDNILVLGQPCTWPNLAYLQR